jgi:hypothetical protein
VLTYRQAILKDRLRQRQALDEQAKFYPEWFAGKEYRR